MGAPANGRMGEGAKGVPPVERCLACEADGEQGKSQQSSRDRSALYRVKHIHS